jgi:predicted nucleic acid-binding protein
MIVDSNVLIDILNPEAARSQAVVAAFNRLSATRKPQINQVIFAEIASNFRAIAQLEAVVSDLDLEFTGLTLEDSFRAGSAFRDYRRKGGPRQSILPDFLIGAQAAVRGWPILTRDPKRFASYFPEVELIDPLKVSDD